jgi:hypothetical protein
MTGDELIVLLQSLPASVRRLPVTVLNHENFLTDIDEPELAKRHPSGHWRVDECSKSMYEVVIKI